MSWATTIVFPVPKIRSPKVRFLRPMIVSPIILQQDQGRRPGSHAPAIAGTLATGETLTTPGKQATAETPTTAGIPTTVTPTKAGTPATAGTPSTQQGRQKR